MEMKKFSLWEHKCVKKKEKNSEQGFFLVEV